MRRTESGTLRETFEAALDCISGRMTGSGGLPPAIAVAFSGGLDSTVLLHLLGTYSKALDTVIHALHVHHGLSPHADAWLEHCHVTASAAGAVFHARRVQIASGDRRGIEAAARAERYAALASMCGKAGISLLLTAHHRDDQAETVLLQLMRGSGLPGLAGMPIFRAAHPLLGNRIALGRPLLDVSRAQIEQEASRAGLTYVTDESNADPRFRRNGLRHDVMPLMKAAAPGCVGAIARTASHAQDALILLNDLADLDLAACRMASAEYGLDVQRLQALSAPRLVNLVRRWLRLANITPPNTAAIHALCDQIIHSAQDGQMVFELGNMQVRRFRSEVLLECKRPTEPEPVQIRWAGEAALCCPQWHGTLMFDAAPFGLPASLLRESVLTLRRRQSSERLQPQPNRPSKTIKSLYQEADIPAWRRAYLPVLCAGSTLVFAAGIGINIRAAVHGDAVVLHWEPFDGIGCGQAHLDSLRLTDAPVP